MLSPQLTQHWMHNAQIQSAMHCTALLNAQYSKLRSSQSGARAYFIWPLKCYSLACLRVLYLCSLMIKVLTFADSPFAWSLWYLAALGLWKHKGEFLENVSMCRLALKKQQQLPTHEYTHYSARQWQIDKELNGRKDITNNVGVD